MKNGYLKVETFIGDRLSPVIGAKVVVECQKDNILHKVFTNENGHSEEIPLKGVDETADSNNPWHVPFQRYNVTVTHKRGFRKIIVRGVEIFPGVDSILPVRMLPDSRGDSEPYEIVIPKRHSESPRGRPNEGKLISTLALNTLTGADNKLIVPSHITVRTSDGNITMPLKEYIKNIASGGSYMPSERAALGAYILIQTSQVLEKVAGCQDKILAEDDFPFVWGRSIFNDVIKTVDGIWGYYFVTSDESGSAPICNASWQESANALAIRGYNPVQIVNYLCPKLGVLGFLDGGGDEVS